MTDLRLIKPQGQPAVVTELVRPGLPTEEEFRAYAGLVAGSVERMRRWRDSLQRTADMQADAIEQMQAAHTETWDFIRWIDEQLRDFSAGASSRETHEPA